MSENPKQIVLLSAYEELTQRETVSLREGNMEATLELQKKKAKLLEKITELQKDAPLRGELAKVLKEKVARLEAIESENAQVLAEHMKNNRIEYRSLVKRSGAATKVRNAYGISEDDRKKPTSLKGQA